MSAAAAAQGGMPAELTSFVGRRLELSEGRRLLGVARLVTLTGPGGVGKTRLARRIADQAARAFPDGTFLVELAELRDPALLEQAVASALGIEDHTRPVAEVLPAFLASRNLLLLMDNCEHLVDSCAALVRDLLSAAAGLRVLATSRQALGVAGEQLMQVSPLSTPPSDAEEAGTPGQYEAVALLVDRTRAVNPGLRLDGGNAGLMARLCRRLEGIPLAIELAAARLRVLSLAELVDLLEDRFAVLTPSQRSGLARHQTVRALVDWSFGLCSPVEQAVWARMSVFAGGADLDAVEAVCAEPGLYPFDAVAGLVDKSVLAPVEVGGRVRYRMLETIREYGADRLAERGETDLMRQQHRDYYVDWARIAGEAWFGPDQRDLLDRLRAEMANLRAALDAALAQPATREQALSLIMSVHWYWPAVGAMEEGVRWTARALSTRPEPTPLGLHALTTAAWQAAVRRDDAGVRTYAGWALALILNEDSAAIRSDRHRAAALLAEVDRDATAAVAAHYRCLCEHQSLGDLYGQVEDLEALSALSSWLGRNEDAIGYLETAMRLCVSQGEECELSELLGNYGEQLWHAQRFDESLAAQRESLALSAGFNSYAMARAIAFIAWIDAATGDGHRAAVQLGAVCSIWPTIGRSGSVYWGRDHVECERRARHLLGEEAFASAYDQGRRMTAGQAVAFARGETRPTARRSVARATVGEELSGREREVAELVARGLSNKEIAHSLVISPRTAEGHVTRIMGKLGFGSRALVASWVAERRAPRELIVTVGATSG